jgi:hypothetical protein
MKCINCGIDNNLNDRIDNLGRCKNCAHEFAFEPQSKASGADFTDMFFSKLITSISVKNTLFFTQTQLFYLLNKRLRSRGRNISLSVIFVISLAMSIVGIGGLSSGEILEATISIVVSIAALSIYLIGQGRKANFLIDREQFDRWLDRWNSINGISEKLILAPEITSLPTVINPEVTAYSFDRVVVCDRAEIAQLLISNNFHFEHNCAILTIDGYPQSIFNTTMEMLRRNSELQVYAFHDCSPNGIQIAHRLRTDANWFPDPQILIIDVGILPRQIIGNRNLLVLESADLAQTYRSLSLAIRANFNSAELAWLDAGNYLELESFSTQKLIRILQRAISESRQMSAIDDDNSISVSVDSFG